MEVTGVLKVKGETQTFNSGFTKREIVVTTTEQYPQHIKIELLKDKADLIDAFNVGDSIKVSINLGGREWINKEGVANYFNSVTGWRVEKFDVDTQNTPSQPQPVSTEAQNNLPF
jgi:hypothetical protein